jgi:CheY-like chemotaxis protein
MNDQLRNVLLVEDDIVDVKTVQRAFNRKQVRFRITVAGNGVEALEVLRSGRVPLSGLLVLLDLNMPRMNGLELLDALRADEELHRLPVVVLTTSNDESDRLRAYDANVAGYIVKPVTFEKFLDVVGTLADYWAMVELP